MSATKHFYVKSLSQKCLFVIAAISSGVVILGCQPAVQTQSLEQAKTRIKSAALDRTGNSSLVNSLHEGVSLWNIPNQQRRLNWHHEDSSSPTITKAQIDLVALSLNGKYGATASGQQVVTWSAQSGRSLGFTAMQAAVQCISISEPEQQMLIGTTTTNAYLLSINQRVILTSIELAQSPIVCALSNDGEFAAFGDQSGRFVIYRRSSKWQLVQSIEHHAQPSYVQFDIDSQMLLSASTNDLVTVHALGERVPRWTQTLEHQSVTAAQLDYPWLVLGFDTHQVQVIDLSKSTTLFKAQIPKRPWYRSFFKNGPQHIMAVALSGATLTVTSSEGSTHRLSITSE